MPLTDKQKRFCDEYILDLNGTQAAIRAGYAKKRADAIGYENLRKPEIEEEIKRLQAERSKRTQITADKVLEELAHIAFDDIKNYLRFYTNPETGEVKVDIKDSDTIDTRAVAEVQLTRNGFKFKNYCKDVALVNLGKHLGLFTERIELTEGVKIIKDTIAEKLKAKQNECS